ncbi:MAG: oxidoreductase-like domain-containing protein [Polaromonas sp.]
MPDAPNDREAALTLFSALQQRALAAGVSLRPPPPEPTTCCGRGCNGCVWAGYYSALDYWREEALLRLQP